MSVWSKEELEAQIGAWKKALLTVSGGKAYSVAGRSLTLQDVGEIRETLRFLERELRALEGGCGPVCVAGRVAR